MQTVQMNVRIDGDIKSSGDRVLANVGYSPSMAVRALWSFLARNEGDEQAIVQVLRSLDSDKDGERERERQRRLAAFERGSHMFEDALERSGVSVSDETASMSAEELMDIAYADRLDGEEASWKKKE
ncbi:MAG: translation repressor RelB [Slackia sp.]|nr:translation repressor RelB [Slackia sp.]